MVLLGHAFGLLVQRPFACGFLGLNAIASLGWGGVVLHQMFRAGAPDGAGATGWAALVMLLALLILEGIVCGLLGVALHRACDGLAHPIDGAAWAAGVLGGVVLAAVRAIVLKLSP